MSESPLVSVVVPTIARRKDLLARALDSVGAQTYPNLEVIVVDEGLPATVQRNIGIERSRGKYVAFLDDDDEWVPDKIECQVKLMEREGAAIVLCYSHDHRTLGGRIVKPPLLVNHKLLIKSFCLSSTSSYLVERKVLDELYARDGTYFRTDLPSGHEYDLALRITEIKDKIMTVPKVLMVQHKTEGQISSSWSKKIKGQHHFMRHWGKEFGPLDYIKSLGVMSLFFCGYFVGDYIYVPINKIKEIYESEGVVRSREPRVAFIRHAHHTFVDRDINILKKHFAVRVIDYMGNYTGAPKILFNMIRGIMWADIVVSRFANDHSLLSVILCKLFGKKSVVVIGGVDVAHEAAIGYGLLLSRRKRWGVKYILENADLILPVDVSLKDNALLLCEPRKIIVVDNGFDTERFSPGSPKEDLVVTVAGINDPMRIELKGLRTFVRAARRMRDVKFIIIGVEGRAFNELKGIVPPNVELIGRCDQKELIEYYRRAKVYCQLSLYEGHPNALCEAMLCGCVPVGTPLSGIKKSIGSEGFYAEYSDVEGTLFAIKKALTTKTRGRERIKKMFPLKRREARLVNLIKKVWG